MSDKPRCETCRFWEDIDGVDSHRKHDGDKLNLADLSGRCRRHAPQFTPRQIDDFDPVDGFWPWTHPNDWCGEWQAVGSVPATSIPPLLLIDDVYSHLWLNRRKLKKLAGEGKISHVVIDGEIYFTPEDIAAYIEKNRVRAKSPV